MILDSPRRKLNKKFDFEEHAHFLTFSCYRRLTLLTNDCRRRWLAEAIHSAREKHVFAPWAYVFMPEHVHLPLKPRRPVYRVAAFEHDLKLAAARRILTYLKKLKSPLLQQLRIDATQSPLRFWQTGGGHDLNVWTIKKVFENASYCHHNPVKRRLVKDPGHWYWSSYRWLELGETDGQPLALDDWDESLLSE